MKNKEEIRDLRCVEGMSNLWPILLEAPTRRNKRSDLFGKGGRIYSNSYAREKTKEIKRLVMYGETQLTFAAWEKTKDPTSLRLV